MFENNLNIIISLDRVMIDNTSSIQVIDSATTQLDVTGEMTNGMCRGTSGLSKILEEEGRSPSPYPRSLVKASCNE
jgi:hypothetical protein